MRRTFPRLLVLAAAVAGLAYAACDDAPLPPSVVPRPSVGRASPVPGQPPVVWLAAQTERVDADRLVVVEPDGPRIALRRLSGEATRFFVRDGREWVRLPGSDAVLIELGTPLCVEALLDDGTYLALRVFVGATCGPAT